MLQKELINAKSKMIGLEEPSQLNSESQNSKKECGFLNEVTEEDV